MAAVFDRAEPQAVGVEVLARLDTCHCGSLGRLQVAEPALLGTMFDALSNRRVRGFLGNRSHAGGKDVEVDVGAHGQQCFVIENGDRFVATLPKSAAGRILFVRKSSDGFLERFHEPAQVAQSFADLGNKLVIGCVGSEQLRRDFQRLAVKSRWVDAIPASEDFFVRPFVDLRRPQIYQQMQMVVENRKATDFYGEDTDQEFEAIFDPLLSIQCSVTQQSCTTHRFRNHVVPRCDRYVDKLRTCYRDEGRLRKLDDASLADGGIVSSSVLCYTACPWKILSNQSERLRLYA